ncbi:hypothetical protein PF004_g3451 [Phytophthora fragariae]|uniref:Uncharacterized protein n=1 Tax=Phytophthora fragariae TaxID=53985 RepID=A0A6G0PLV7_9STRA|nr:hypothetical protein PF004_g3451 [Phytophthora fragariae]
MEDSEEERSDVDEETVEEQSEDVDEEEEEEDAGVKTEPETEVKTEYGVEMEPYEETGYYDNEEVYETEPPREERSLNGPSAYQGYGGVYYTGPGYGTYGDYGGHSQPLEYEGYGEAYEEPRYHRGPSGFITRYTGPETRSLLSPVLDQVNALAQEVRTFVQDEKEWRDKVKNQLQAPRQNSYQEPSTVAAIPPPTQTLGCQLRSRRRDVGDGGYGVSGKKYLIFCLGLSV